MKIISCKFLFFVGLILLSTISSGQKKNDALKNGKLNLAFGYKSGDKVQTIFPLNGGNINKDSLSLADQLIFVYKTKEKSYIVKDACYMTCFMAPGRETIDYQTKFEYLKDQFKKLVVTEKIIIYVNYIILESNDTVFIPSPMKSVGVYNKELGISFNLQNQKYPLDKYYSSEEMNKMFCFYQPSDSVYFRKEHDSTFFEAPAFEFIVK